MAGDVTVKNIGARLMTDYVLPLEVVALLLTAALIGAVIIAMPNEAPDSKLKAESSKLKKSTNF